MSPEPRYGRKMSRRLLVATAALFLLAGCGGSTGASRPGGLTAYGQAVWNIDALLHDTFGKRDVWVDYIGSYPNFSTRFVDLASSVPWPYTFSAARHSTYAAVSPKRPPGIGTFVTGSDVPMRIEGAYISCGHGRWLYSRSGQAYPGGDMWCGKPEHSS
jgi:hypothetical protein